MSSNLHLLPFLSHLQFLNSDPRIRAASSYLSPYAPLPRQTIDYIKAPKQHAVLRRIELGMDWGVDYSRRCWAGIFQWSSTTLQKEEVEEDRLETARGEAMIWGDHDGPSLPYHVRCLLFPLRLASSRLRVNYYTDHVPSSMPARISLSAVYQPFMPSNMIPRPPPPPPLALCRAAQIPRVRCHV